MKKLGTITIISLLLSFVSSTLAVNFYDVSKLVFNPTFDITKPIITILNYMSLVFFVISLFLAIIFACASVLRKGR